MNRNPSKRSHRLRQRRLNCVMMIAFAAVLFAGLFAQLTMVARLSGQAKLSRQAEREIRELSATADNLNLSLNQYGSLERVETQARRLGMTKPSEGQIRVVSLPGLIGGTSAQSAENVGAEEMR